MHVYYKENIFTCSYHLKTITANQLLTLSSFFNCGMSLATEAT
jgi:hypothetical protein